MRMLTCEPILDKEDVRQCSLLSRTNRTLRHMQSTVFYLMAKMFHFLKVVCHLHEIKQVEAVNAEAEGVDATWMKMLV